MAVNTGYTTAIRSALNEKGVANDRISYSPTKGVMVDGNTFYQPEKVYNGTSFTSPTNFANAWNTYSKTYSQTPTTSAQAYGQPPQTQPTQPTQQTQQSQQPQQYNYNPYASSNTVNNNPYTSQTDDIINQLLNYNQNQQPFDPYSSNAYKAAEAQAQRAAQQNTRAAQESYGSAGFGRSTALGDRVAGINNNATEYLMTQVLPQIEAQEQARRQQEFSNLMAALNPLMSQQGRADNLVQQDFNNRITEGQLTGNYINAEAEAIINSLLGLKSDTEANWRAYTPEQRVAATQQADVYRNQLASMGIDPSLFGANVSSSAASQNKGTIGRTLQGQQLDWQKQTDQRDFNYQQGRDQVADNRYDNEFQYQKDRDSVSDEKYWSEREYQAERDAIADERWQQEFGVTLAQITGYFPDGTPTSDQQQRELANLWTVADQTGTIPNELADLYGIPRGTQTQTAKQIAVDNAFRQQEIGISQQNANTSRYNAETGRMQENRMASEPKSTTSSSTTKIDSKTSYDNYNILTGDMQNAGSKDKAIQLLQLNADYLTDADYRKMMDYINEIYQ